MTEHFSVVVTVRDYEVDSNGHIAGSVLLQYGQHARWACLRAAGVPLDHGPGIHGPVSLEEKIRYHRELRAGEDVEITCMFTWPAGKTFRIEQQIRQTDGTVVAEITNVAGVMDLQQRRLIDDPAALWRSQAAKPHLLGLEAG